VYGICSENSSFVEGSHNFFAKKRKLRPILTVERGRAPRGAGSRCASFLLPYGAVF
jgi:hypothetical protein